MLVVVNNAKEKKHPFYDKVKCVIRIFKKKHEVIYLGEKIEKSSLILSNHVGMSAPLSWDLYPEFTFRFWGTYEMNGDLKTVYKYLSETYFHNKMHWPLFLSKLFCLIAAPVMKGFYKGLEVISTYTDLRLKQTVNTSLDILNKGHNIIVFPEDSSSGYFDKLTKFYSGFLFLAKTCYKKELDVPIFVSYYSKKQRKIVVDKPIKYSSLLEKYKDLSHDEIAFELLNRCNQLGEDIASNKY